MPHPEKAQLRKLIKQRISLLSIAEKEKQSLLLYRQIAEHPRFVASDVVLLYASLPDEPDTTTLLRDFAQSKTILLPVVQDNDIILRRFKDFSHIETGRFGINEPTGLEYKDIPHIQLAIIPGRAFTKEGYRLGRGGGYYDRLLSHPDFKAYKLGCCFKQQIVPTLPVEPHDIQMQEVIFPI